MKRTFAIVAGVLTVGAGLYFGTHLSAQGPAGGSAAPAPTMRMRLVNLQYVIKNYKRTEALRAEHAALFKKYDDEIQQYKKLAEQRQAQMNDPKYSTAEKEAIEKEIKRLQREMQDKGEEARTALAKKEGDLITLIYNEVEDSVKKYAAMNSIELVMHYNDAVAESDRRSANNVARKMSAGACMPMHVAAGLDISDDIVQALNRQYTGPSAGAAPVAPVTPR